MMINFNGVNRHKGDFNIKGFDVNTKELVEEIDKNNLLMDAYLDGFITALSGSDPDMQIRYLAIGDGTTAVTGQDTKLSNERKRIFIANRDKTNTGELTSIWLVASTQANFEWQELGIYGGSTASATKDSGKLLARVLINIDKTVDKEYQVTRRDRQIR